MHPKTIRRYIREGTLEGTKVGGQWRVRSIDLKQFMNRDDYVEELKHDTADGVIEFIEGKSTSHNEKIQVCTIVDFYIKSPEEIKPIVDAVIDLMNNGGAEQKDTKFQYVFFSEEGKGRFTFWGNPIFISKMLNIFAEVM